MERLRLLTVLLNLVFVVYRKRRYESIRGLGRLGILPNQQTHPGLPDGNIAAYAQTLAGHIVAIVKRENARQIVTLGPTGYDNNPDHIAGYDASVIAAQELTDAGFAINLLALNANHTGEHKVLAQEAIHRKLGAMACHESQFPIAHASKLRYEDTTFLDLAEHYIETDFWEDFHLYHPLILEGETYNLHTNAAVQLMPIRVSVR